MFFSRTPRTVPTAPAARQDFLNKFPPEGEVWLIITFRWDLTAIFADQGEICADTSVKKPHMASGGGFSTFADESAVRQKALDHLTLILKGYNDDNYTVRVFTVVMGDKVEALAARDRRAQEMQKQLWAAKAEYTEPSPRYR